MGTRKFTAGGNPAMDWHPIQGGIEILLVASCYRNGDKLRPDGSLGLYTDFILTYFQTLMKSLNYNTSYIYQYFSLFSSHMDVWKQISL